MKANDTCVSGTVIDGHFHVTEVVQIRRLMAQRNLQSVYSGEHKYLPEQCVCGRQVFSMKFYPSHSTYTAAVIVGPSFNSDKEQHHMTDGLT